MLNWHGVTACFSTARLEASQMTGIDYLFYAAAAALVAYLLWRAFKESGPKQLPYD